MKHLIPAPFRDVLMTALLILTLADCALAQTPAAAPPAPENLPQTGTTGRPAKAVQRIRTEDAGTRIDEVRVGGETQSITVQPKSGSRLPSYEVMPPDNARGTAPSANSSDTNGPRVWNVLKF